MKVTKEGLDLIKRNEGCRLTAYQDSIGIWTIGYGQTGSGIRPGMVITQEQADKMLSKTVDNIANSVETYVNVPLSDNQFSALVSFAYNVGIGSLSKSGLLDHINEGNFKAAMESLLQWNKAGGRVLSGLTRRREEEKALFEEEA